MSVTFDPFLYLTLPLSAADQAVGLGDAVSLFCREESLDPENLWLCPNCQRQVPALKKLDLWKLPRLLVVHLKRFEWVQQRAAGCPPVFYVKKLSCTVNFQQESIDFSSLCAEEAPQKEPLIYDLVATVDHHGTSAEVGHYTAACRRPDGWYNFDDSVVTPLGEQATVVGPQNYMLILQKRGGTPTAIAEQRPSLPQAWPHVVDINWSFLTGSEDFDQ
eukprot:TRINITY_DN2511_c0_g2_i1.p1 TRINITY_DN2511_c0_g2~~TRINITY_DN2511_c0_g2_i1.p1  ORF type:complete len:241 (+),score=44.80 TRINITY_DN2511_c0_g2_i1:70-723(+)